MMVDNEGRITSSQNGKLMFTDRRKSSIRLCVSNADAYKIRKGCEVQMFQPRSLSVLKVRSYTSNPASSSILEKVSLSHASTSAQVFENFPRKKVLVKLFISGIMLKAS